MDEQSLMEGLRWWRAAAVTCFLMLALLTGCIVWKLGFKPGTNKVVGVMICLTPADLAAAKESGGKLPWLKN